MITNLIQTQLHGVFLKIKNSGVLLTGVPGVGKSKTALGLVERGHQLIADDLVKVTKHQHTLIGRCPTKLHNLLKIRGVELLNIATLYGKKAIRRQYSLNLIINLQEFSKDQPPELDLLEGNYSMQWILNTAIPQINLTTQINYDLALLIEVLVKNYELKTIAITNPGAVTCA